MSKPFYQERVLEIAAVTTVAGTALTILGLLDVTDRGSIDLYGWGFYLLIGGVILLATGIYWMYSFRKMDRRFKHLMEERSKANVIKYLDEMEYIAWRMPTRYEERLYEKKKSMKL